MSDDVCWPAGFRIGIEIISVVKYVEEFDSVAIVTLRLRFLKLAWLNPL